MVVQQHPINWALNEKWVNWVFGEERRKLQETQRKEIALPCVLPVFFTKTPVRELAAGTHLLFWHGLWLNATCCFLPCILYLLVGKAPPKFIMENMFLRTPDNVGNEIPAPQFTVYKPFQVHRVFPVILTTNLLVVMHHMQNAQCLTWRRNFWGGCFLERHYHSHV